MSELSEKKEQFRFLYEKFLVGCDAIEYQDAWDKDEYGEMESYFTNEFVSIVMNLMNADSSISADEVRTINELFGFHYSVAELKEIYELCGEDIDAVFDEGVLDSFELLNDVNEEAAECYVDMLNLAADIIVESDGVVTDKEKERVQRLKEILKY